MKTPYWRADAEGRYWIGRGLVQLTHRANYQRMSRETGIDLVADPARAMEMEVAVAILFAGMEKGLFTGRRLADYFAGDRADSIQPQADNKRTRPRGRYRRLWPGLSSCARRHDAMAPIDAPGEP